MLHLAIICIVCAVSALNEAFTERKNNESNIFCHFDGEGGHRNLGNITSPNVYNVAVRNSSDRAEQTITNNTNSFFYDCIINQYQDKSSTCSIMESVPLGKKFCSNLISPVRKKRNDTNILSKFTAKTLRPPLDTRICFCCDPPLPTKSKQKAKKCPWGLKPKEKKLLFCLKRCKGGKINTPLKKRKRHLDKLKVDDDLDLNKRIEKVVKEIALENQRKENSEKNLSTSEDMKQNEDDNDYNNNEVTHKKIDFFPFFNHLKRIFGFSKEYFDSKLAGNNEETVKDDFSDKAARSYDVLKTKRKTTRYRRNPNENHIRYRFRGGPFSVHRKSLNDNSSPRILSRKRKRKRNNAYFRTSQSLRRHRNKRILFCLKNRKKCKDRDYPMRIRFGFPKETRTKRGDNKTTVPEIELTTIVNQNATGSSTSTVCPQNETFATSIEVFEEILTTGNNSVTETVSVSSTVTNKIVTTTECRNATDDEKGDQTLEKPFLKEDLKSGEFKNQKLHSDENQMTPLLTAPSSDEYNHELKSEYLTPERYLKIRHALRTYLVQNNLFPVNKRSANRKKKSCEENIRSYKCWKSAPLLCLPYIKKCEEDQIKYLIRMLQGMLGKPFPQKAGIFDKTKYKPCRRRPENMIQVEDEEELECSTTATPPQTNTPPVNSCPPCPSPLPPVNTCTCPPCPTTFNPCPLTIPPPCSCENQNNQQQDCNPIQTGPPFTFPAMEGRTTSQYNYDEFTTPAPPCECTSNACPIPAIPQPVLPPLASPVPVNTLPSTSPTPPTPSSCSSSVKPSMSSSCNPPLPPIATNFTSFSITNFSVTNFPAPFNFNSVQAPAPPPQTTKSDLRPPSIPSKYLTSSSDNNIHDKDFGPIPNLNLEPPVGIMNVPLSTETTITTKNAPNNLPSDSEPIQQPQFRKQKQYMPGSQSMSGSHNMRGSQNMPGSQFMQGSQNVPGSQFIQGSQNMPGSQFIQGSQNVPGSQFMQGSQDILPDVEQPQEWSFTTTISIQRESFSQNREGIRGHKMRHKPEYYFEPKVTRKNLRQQLHDQKHSLMRNMHHENKRRFEGNRGYVRESLPNEDQINQPLNYNLPQNRLFRMKHRGKLRKELLRRKPPPADYEFLDAPPPTQDDKYPPERKFDVENLQRMQPDNIPLPYHLQRDERKHKRINSKRHKRGDDYYYEKFENYNDYLDPVYGEENFKQADSKIFDMAPSDVLTPPAYEMFSELARAMTATEPTIVTTMKNITNVPPTTSAVQMEKKSDKITDSPVLGETSKSPFTAETAETNQTEISQNVQKPENITQQFLNSTVSGPMSYETDFNCGPEEIINGTESSEESEKKLRKTNFFPYKSASQTKPTESIFDPECGTTESTSKAYIKENKAPQGSQEVLTPTTLKTASIAKGPKKLATKPSPKVYSKVYPDSIFNGEVTTETIATTKSTTATNPRAKTTPLMSSSSPADLKLQMLAVCEGYLEVVKLIKSQNRSLGEELDMNLARYCESVISQSFNSQSDKPKINDTPFQWSGNPVKNSELKAVENAELSERQIRGNVDVVAINTSDNDKKDTAEGNETATGKSSESERKDRRKDSASHEKKQKNQPTNEDADDLLKKGMSKEQLDLIKLLNKRKKALMSWLLNSKEVVKSGDGRETEYFDDGDFVDTGPDLSQYSGTIKPKRIKNNSGKGKKNSAFVNESIFPVYAKQYGYESGGELREIEVLWRKVNEKTHEKKIFKNVSVLALLLTSTYGPDINPEDTELVGANGYENEDLSEIQLKSEGKVSFLTNAAANTTNTTNENTSTITTVQTTTVETSKEKNATVTFISKPDPSTIVGTPTEENNTHSNNTRKPSHRFGVAKDIFKEYSIEFLDYAVYILPVMFTILFLFCCLCCAVYILNMRKKHKKKKKQKEKVTSTDETTETTEESEPEAKKRKRESKRRRRSENGDDVKKNKKFWNVLKIHPSKNDTDENQTNHKKKFLKFLKGKKDEEKVEPDSGESKPPETDEEYNEPQKSVQEEKTDEAAERRELIALLEELKKIETENSGEKKEVKSVQVQYMMQEEEDPVFRRPDFSYPYEKNVFGLPKGFFSNKEFPFRRTNVGRDYDLYEDVNELTELLPCEGRDDFLRRSDFKTNQDDRCERFLKVYRDSGVNRTEPFVDKNESENRRFVFNKYRGISLEPNEDLLGVTQKNVGTENPKNSAFLREMENFKRQLNKKKQVRLKDDGVLCRL